MRVEKLSRLRFLSLATNSDPVSFRSTYFTLTIYLLILIAFYNRVVAAYPPKGNDWSFQSQLNFKLMELVKQYASGKPSVSHLSPIGFLASSGVVQSPHLLQHSKRMYAIRRSSRQGIPRTPRLESYESAPLAEASSTRRQADGLEIGEFDGNWNRGSPRRNGQQRPTIDRGRIHQWFYQHRL